jgi:transcriptional regulator with XRE-family HTH domain
MALRVRVEVLEEARKRKKYSLSKLSRRADLGYSTVYNIFNGTTKDPSIQTIGAITRVLGLSLEEVTIEIPDEEEDEKGNIRTPGFASPLLVT